MQSIITVPHPWISSHGPYSLSAESNYHNLVGPSLIKQQHLYIYISMKNKREKLNLRWAEVLFPKFQIVSISKFPQNSPRCLMPSFLDKQLVKK